MKYLFFVLALTFTVPTLAQEDTTQNEIIEAVTEEVAPEDDIFPGGETTLEELVDWHNLLHGALVLLFGFLAKGIPALKKVPEFVYVVLSGGIVLAVAFLALGFGEVIQYVFSFLGAVGIYDIIVNPIRKAAQANAANVDSSN